MRAQLSISGAGLVRYAYGAPFAVLMVAGYLGWRGLAFPHLGVAFFGLAAAGGLAQILGTNALIAAFGQRGFVVGTAFSKTEAMQAALFSLLIFGEPFEFAFDSRYHSLCGGSTPLRFVQLG